MQVLLDNLSATLIGGVLVLILLSVGLRVGGAETETQLYELSRRQSQAIAQQLEADLLNVGYGLPSTTDAIEEWTDSTFTFNRRADTTSTAPVIQVSYRRLTVGTVEVDGTPAPLYRVERLQDGASEGGAPASLSAFDLDLVERDGTPTSDPADAVGLRVVFKTSFGSRADDQTSSASRYERTFYPANLDIPASITP